MTDTTGRIKRHTALDAATIAIMAAMLEVVKQVLNAIPNVELISFLLVVFTLRFGVKKTITAAWLFTAMEIFTWGIQLWVVFYIYAWPVLILVTYMFRRYDKAIVFALISGLFGLSFGALTSIVYVITSGIETAIAWWTAGIPYDLIHGASNFVIMLVLYRPVMNVLRRLDV
jgi:energy-coupling factor transport system substrate-specific component